MSDQAVIVSLSVGHETMRVGTLWFHERRGWGGASFEYNRLWLRHPEKFSLDPALQLTEGTFHTKAGFGLFGAIGDSAPDRWGRVLMRRAHIAKHKANRITPGTLSELDYLLGVQDEARQGALRFSLAPEEKVFLAPHIKTAIPPFVRLPQLLSATERFIEDDESAADLQLLLAPGSSLGGARPKASVRDKDGTLAMAKFPKKDDEYKVVLWEAVAFTLAKKARIDVPDWRIEYILGKPVLVIKRFDRTNGQRIPFLSGMSMLGASDHEQHSYLEMADALAQYGACPTEDMEALWRRIVFTIMISNTDDHLRNHGFIYERQKGWRLSPAYDMNPTPLHLKPPILTTAIDFDDTHASLETALHVAKAFRVSGKRADQIVREVRTAVKSWRGVAQKIGLSKAECDTMRSAFREHPT